MIKISPGQTLLIDADDTLWENNVYFERAISAFISYLNHQTFTPEEVREALNNVEHQSIRKFGYGLHSFTHSLIVCFEQLCTAPVTEEMHRQIVSFAHAIREQEIRLLPGVGDLLPELATRHQLILMTKGDATEQADKFARSGLDKYFSAVEIVAEKDAATYRAVVDRHQLDPRKTWMIGNSPKSDINPALTAGLNAVFLFHNDTWVLEHATIDTPPATQQLIELDCFSKLRAIF